MPLEVERERVVLALQAVRPHVAVGVHGVERLVARVRDAVGVLGPLSGRGALRHADHLDGERGRVGIVLAVGQLVRHVDGLDRHARGVGGGRREQEQRGECGARGGGGGDAQWLHGILVR